MIIRKAEISDFESLLILSKKLFDFEEQFDRKYNLDWTYSDIGRSYFKTKLEHPNSIIFIAEIENEVVGYILGFVSNNLSRLLNPICEIENTYVVENFRNRGIGTKLIESVKNEAKNRNVKILRVGAIAQNTEAIKFYKSNGLEETNIYLEEEL